MQAPGATGRKNTQAGRSPPAQPGASTCAPWTPQPPDWPAPPRRRF